MKKLENLNNIDVENKMYVVVNKWGMICCLKNFTIAEDNGRQVQRWRIITMDGRSSSNVLLQQDKLQDGAFMYKTPVEALKSKLVLGGPAFYECDGIVDFIQNAHKVIEETIK